MKRVGRNAVVPGGVEFRPSQNAREVPSTQVGAQRTDANLGHRQLSALGHPVVGDRKYHPEQASERRITRVALHAAHLEFAHPRTGENVSIDCEPPADFQSLLQALKLPSRTHR